MKKENYLQINKAHWNGKVDVHVQSDFYNQEAFLSGKSSLNQIELDLLGDVANLDILHLQCHFGQDSLSLARMGARVCGVDFSEKAISVARKTADDLNLDADFICSDVMKLPHHLDRQFDIVFASYGVIGWHPNMDDWARLVCQFLKPGGKHLLVEFHPVIWMWSDDFSKIQYSYFNRETIVDEEEGTYANTSADLQSTSVSWNHSLDEVTGAMFNEQLQLKTFREYDYSPYDCFQKLVKTADGFQIKGMEGKIPMVFAMEFLKPM